MTYGARRIVAGCVVALLFSAPLSAQRVAAAESAPAESPRVAELVQRLGLEESATPVRERSGWSRPRKVLVWNLQPDAVPQLQAAAPGVELLLARDAAEAARLAPQADAVLGVCTPELLAAGPRIRWIQSYSAGVERCVAIPALRERNVLLTNMQRVAGPVMAEHVLALVLAYARGLYFYIPEQQAARWTR